jgi:hypothetical protein
MRCLRGAVLSLNVYQARIYVRCEKKPIQSQIRNLCQNNGFCFRPRDIVAEVNVSDDAISTCFEALQEVAVPPSISELWRIKKGSGFEIVKDEPTFFLQSRQKRRLTTARQPCHEEYLATHSFLQNRSNELRIKLGTKMNNASLAVGVPTQ